VFDVCILNLFPHSNALSVKSTSVDKDRINGPSFYGSYVEHMII
jgi:hypothetical protein